MLPALARDPNSIYDYGMAYCFSCKHEFDDRTRVYRNTLCPSCGKELKVCLNCRFYDPSAHWECRESIPEAVREKDRANFCDFFALRAGSPAAAPADAKADQARDSLRKLFGEG